MPVSSDIRLRLAAALRPEQFFAALGHAWQRDAGARGPGNADCFTFHESTYFESTRQRPPDECLRSLVRLMQAGRLGVALFAALAMLRPGFAHAQAGLAYAGGGVLVGHLSPRAVNDGTPSTTYVNTSDSTTVTGLVGEVGWFVRPRVTLGVEIGVPARLTITQDYSYFSPYIREPLPRIDDVWCDRPSSCGGDSRHARTRRWWRCRPASALERGNRAIRNQSVDPFSSETARTRLSFGATGGGELDVHVTRRLDVVTQASSPRRSAWPASR